MVTLLNGMVGLAEMVVFEQIVEEVGKVTWGKQFPTSGKRQQKQFEVKMYFEGPRDNKETSVSGVEQTRVAMT